MSSEEYKKIEEVLQFAPGNRHSFFQMKYFIIGKEPTTQAQMWQCLRELQSRKLTIDSLQLSIDETKDQLDLSEISLMKEIKLLDNNFLDYPKELVEKEKVIKLRQHDRKKQQLEQSLVQMEESLKFAQEEAKFFLELFETIQKIEPLKEYDDVEAQQEYWNEHITQQINLKLLLHQPLDIELVQTALSLNKDAPIRIQMQHTLGQIANQLKGSDGKTQNNEP